MIQLGARLGRLATRLGLTLDRRGLLRTGVLLALLYALYALAYPDRENRALRHVFGWAGTLAFALLWWRGALQIRTLEARRAMPWRMLLGFFVLFAALAVAIRPFHSSDVYAYVSVGRLQAAYDLNPYVHTAVDVEGWEQDPLLSGTWRDVPCTYGFLFARMTEGAVRLGSWSSGGPLLVFKLLGLLSIVLCAWQVDALLRRLGRPGRGFALFTLLWSPFLLLHFVADAHNDLWMALCVLLALRWTVEDRWVGVVPALLAGALIKHLALAVLPFAGILLVRSHGWWRAALSTALGLVLVGLVALPYTAELADARWERIGSLLTQPWNSLQAALVYGYSQLAGALPALADSASAVTVGVRVLFGLAFLAFYGWRCVRALRRRDYAPADMIEDALVVFFVLLCLASAAWHPWYLGMFLPGIFLLPQGHPVRGLTLWIAGFQMLLFSPLAKARMLEALGTLALPMWLWWRRRHETTP